MTDHYASLGIHRNATLDEIKNAYWKRAKETYPAGGETRSEEYLRVKAAYDVLRDSSKRAAYDAKLPSTDLIPVSQEAETEDIRQPQRAQFTTPDTDWLRYRPDPTPLPINKPVGQSSSAKPPSPTACWSEAHKAETGSAYHVRISLRQSYHGIKVNLTKTNYVLCARCSGKGFILEDGPKCTICKGSGSAGQKNFFSALVFGDPCENCQGSGKTKIPKDCDCKEGKSIEFEKGVVDLPRGIRDGAVVASSKDESLLVKVREDSWDRDYTGFTRDGDDLLFTVELTKTQLRKGYSFTLETVSGETRWVKIPPGSAEDYQVTLPRFGMPKSGGTEFGHLHIRLRLRSRKTAAPASSSSAGTGLSAQTPAASLPGADAPIPPSA